MSLLMEGIAAEGYDRTYTDRQLVARIYRYFKPQRRLIIIVSGLIVVTAVIDIVLPIALARGIDLLATERTASTIGLLVAAILGAGIVSWTANYVRQWYTARMVGDVVLDVQRDAMASILAQDLSFYDTFPSGGIVSRVTSDTEAFAGVVTLTLNFISQLLLVMLIIGVLLYINHDLALLTFAITPLIVGVALGFRRLARVTSVRTQRVFASLNANIAEVMRGITVAKNFHQEQTLYDEFTRLNAQESQLAVRTGLVYNVVFSLMAILTGFGTVLVVYYGGTRVLTGAISAGAWFLFVQSIDIFWRPLTNVASFWSLFQQGLSASERVFALIDTQPSVIQRDRQPVHSLAGRIEFEQMTFRYTEQEPVLENFTLAIQPGETVALVGHTGAGKSTLGKLIMRFYEYQGGHLFVDGRDIRRLDLQGYRRQIGVVPQLPFLFDGTVAENIRYARPMASDSEVAAVANRIGGGDWLTALPAGLATPVGELGRGLSLGQRQIVAFCRVLLQEPAIIILDEATASVDPLTEAQIHEGLDVVLAGRTALIIAHRLSTVRQADRIIVMQAGRIVEEGRHDALLKQNGHYAHLFDTYFRHQALDYEPRTERSLTDEAHLGEQAGMAT